MADKDFIRDNGIDDESPKVNTKINPVPKPEVNIGIDTVDDFWENIIEQGEAQALDASEIENFSQISRNRDVLYQTLDTMAEDPTIAAVLEIYAEDATETNDDGRTVWVESSDTSTAQYVEFLLNSLQVEKYIYQWVYSLVKYGDIYLRLFHQSDFEDTLLKDTDKTRLNEKFNQVCNALSEEEYQKTKNKLDEQVRIRAYSKGDKLVNYVELVYNPGEMFELTKFGKSYAYVRTNTLPQQPSADSIQMYNTSANIYKYQYQDVDIFNAVSFVHGSLQDDSPRTPEQIQISRQTSLDHKEMEPYTYNVRRGQSILYSVYKIWRQMMLLENSLLLNRLTKSSILRIIGVEVGDMPKDRVSLQLRRIKQLVEQKATVSTNNNMSEYTNPGAMENNIYIPTHNGLGAITTQQVGGDVNVKDIADIDYFKNKFYSAVKVPKTYLGDLEDGAGFNGGTSLSIVSSRYAKTVKRIQSSMIQCLTDLVNILLIDRGLDTYVNKFTLRMQAPVTQEELDKRDNTSSKIGISDDVMRLVDGIEDEVIKLKILKSLLANAITNTEVINLIQEQIDMLEADEETETNMDDDLSDSADDDFDLGSLGSTGGSDFDFGDDSDFGSDDDFDLDTAPADDADMGEDTLPSPADLGAGDFSDMI